MSSWGGCGTLRSKIVLAIALVFFCLLNLQGFQETGAGKAEHPRFTLSNPLPQKRAVIYAGRSFHDEITSSMSCMIYSIGYHVTVYYDEGVSIAGYHPVSWYKKQNSQAFYGRCVHQWIPISSIPSSESTSVDVLVYITYPMKTGHHTLDTHALLLLKQTGSANADVKVLLVTHHAKDQFWKYMPEIEKYVGRKQVTFLFLAEHTYLTAIDLLRKNGSALPAYTNTDVGILHVEDSLPYKVVDSLPYKVAYIYPVLPLQIVFTHEQTQPYLSLRSSKRGRFVDFAVQGRFGGKHSKRRNIAATFDCLNSLSPRTNQSRADYRLLLIGHMTGDLGLPAKSKSVQVQKSADLSPARFYAAVTGSSYLVASLGGDMYMHSQATSTVPTALNTGTPLVSTSAFLQLYPCLREAPVHVRMNQRTECESLHYAAQLSNQDYKTAKAEIEFCNAQYFKNSLHTLRLLLT